MPKISSESQKEHTLKSKQPVSTRLFPRVFLPVSRGSQTTCTPKHTSPESGEETAVSSPLFLVLLSLFRVYFIDVPSPVIPFGAFMHHSSLHLLLTVIPGLLVTFGHFALLS